MLWLHWLLFLAVLFLTSWCVRGIVMPSHSDRGFQIRIRFSICFRLQEERVVLCRRDQGVSFSHSTTARSFRHFT
eukprot:c13122_g2_i1 orf=2-223(-)